MGKHAKRNRRTRTAMKFLKIVTGSLPLLLLLGCSNPADKVPAAKVSQATNAPSEEAQPPPPAEPAGRYFAFGPSSGAITFIGSKVTGRHNGGFKKFSGEFRVADGRLAGAGNKVVIDTDSLWADNDRVTGHLKSPDFFNVAQFPTA